MWLLAAAAPRELQRYRNLRPKLVVVLALLRLPLGEGDDGGVGGDQDEDAAQGLRLSNFYSEIG